MFCPGCGRPNPENRTVCEFCGQSLNQLPDARTQVSAPPSDTGKAEPPGDAGATVVPSEEIDVEAISAGPTDAEEASIRSALAERYEILRRLGSGGMATVYLAREIALDREVAIKVLPRAFLRDNDFVTRFKHEARVAAALEHPHIVRIHQIGEGQDLCYIVMSYIAGGSIGDEIRHRGTIDLDDLVRWSMDTCSALHHAHAHGIVHRDLKPDNIMLDGNRRAVVTDFGIARATIGARLTQTGAVIGTPQYMSPKQAQGKELDGRSDIYSMGMVLYQMATGTLPFQGSDAVSLMYKHVHEFPEPPDVRNPAIPAWLRDIILKCLAKRPEDRFATAGELSKALAERHRPKIAKTALMPDRPARKSRRGFYFGLAALIILALGAGAYWFTTRPQSTLKPAVTAPAGQQAAPGETANIDDQAFRQAEMVNTEKAFTVYLQAFPQGRHAEEARKQIEFLKSLSSKQPQPSTPSAAAPSASAPQSKTPAPQTDTSSEDNLAWQVAVLLDTPQAYETYLKLYPSGLHAAEAKKKSAAPQKDANSEDNLAWQLATLMNTVESYNTYLKLYPSGIHAAEAKTKLAALSEQETQSAAAKAEEEIRRDDQAWRIAESTGTPDAFNAYLIALPEGRHATEAKTKLAALEARTAQRDQVRLALNALSMKLVDIPGGSFLMGSDKGGGDEKPVHTVTLAAFQMTDTEVTQSQYQAVMGNNPSFFKSSGNNPVERVSWFDAIAFCNKLSERAKLEPCYTLSTGACDFSKSGFRLPTEAEWEYACRAETGGDYSTGNSPADLARAGWYADNSGERPHPVGQKAPNAWRLFDLHGNVWEYTNDWYAKDYYAKSPKDNPTGPSSGGDKVLRGGSWIDNATGCKASTRRSYEPKKSYSDIGFRVVRR
jgi:serine/threonine protein kinase/formylglycine-generating enzyme required for sulfatase activity